jgi:hypothetical protein
MYREIEGGRKGGDQSDLPTAHYVFLAAHTTIYLASSYYCISSVLILLASNPLIYPAASCYCVSSVLILLVRKKFKVDWHLAMQARPH